MAKRYTYPYTRPGGQELLVEFDFTPGHPGHGPSYASGGDPPEGDLIEIVMITARGVELITSVEEDEAITEWLYENWEVPGPPEE